MKFCFLLIALCSLNLSLAQDSGEEYEYFDDYKNRYVVEGGLSYWIPQGDFGRKSPKRNIGGNVTVLRQINHSRMFLGLNYSSRRIDIEEIFDFEPDLDLQAKISNVNYSVLGRFYPQLYLSIFEFFADGGAGIHVIRTVTRDFDKVTEEYFNQNTIQVDQGFFFYGGGGFHVSLDESWFLTGKAHSYFGPSIDFQKRKDDTAGIIFPEEAFELTTAAYRATTISLSLSFIF